MKGRKIAMLVIALLTASILGYLYFSSEGIFNSSTKLFAFVDDPTGLSTKSIIQINGFKIGEVNDLNVSDQEIVIEMSIDEAITISKSSQLFVVPRGVTGEKNIDVEFIDEGSEYYNDGDTIKSIILNKSLRQKFDTKGEHEAKLKEFSKVIGSALLDYAESPLEKCDPNQIGFVLNRLTNYPDSLNEKDAYILIENQCKQNVEYSQVQNELIFRLLTINPQLFINILNQNNFEQEIIDGFLAKVESPISDEFNMEGIIGEVNRIDQSRGTQALLKALTIAKDK